MGILAISDERIVAFGTSQDKPKTRKQGAQRCIVYALYSDPRMSQVQFESVHNEKLVMKIDAPLFGAGTSGTIEHYFELGERAVLLYSRISRCTTWYRPLDTVETHRVPEGSRLVCSEKGAGEGKGELARWIALLLTVEPLARWQGLMMCLLCTLCKACTSRLGCRAPANKQEVH